MISLKHLFKYIKLNYLSRQIFCARQCRIILLSDTIWQLAPNSKIFLDGNLIVGWQQVKGARQQTRIWLESGAELHVKGNFTIGANSFIRIWKNSSLVLSNGFINEGVQIIAGDGISIGNDCVIGRDVIIRSYDGHSILLPNYQITKRIEISNHVWIGQCATILKGVTIGEGSVVAANTVLTKDVPKNCLVGGNPASIIKRDIQWK